MGMSLGGNSRQRAEINVTPMIDVLLVLIIIFMVITPLAPRGLNALVPQSSDRPGPSAPSHDIVVTVYGDGTVRLNQEAIAIENLHDRLAVLFRSNLNHVIFVRGDKGINFAPVAQVIDIARGVGLDRVALMTQ